ncbi:MAG TPA: hypothetical protein VEC37_03830, partial [Bacillota bacterium]|nr:hypothetical protein [Bacillota bacterium]
MKLRSDLTVLSVKRWCADKLESWAGEILQALLLVQLALSPVLPFSFPLLYATIVLMLLVAAPTDRTGVKNQEWWLLLLIFLFAMSAFLGTGFHEANPQLGEWVGGQLLAWLVGKGFSPEFVRKVLRYLVFSSIIWLVTGFAQVWAGVPTPPGWVGTGQDSVIAVRSFSVFGNPNIYAIYLLTITGLAAGLTRSG